MVVGSDKTENLLPVVVKEEILATLEETAEEGREDGIRQELEEVRLLTNERLVWLARKVITLELEDDDSIKVTADETVAKRDAGDNEDRNADEEDDDNVKF